MEPTIEGDQGASTQSGTIISQATTTPADTNGSNQNGAMLQIASNLDWVVSTLKAAQNPPPTARMADDSPLSTADLVKILEIALTEIRANQNFAFSVLGFAAIAGGIIQKTHFGGSTPHHDLAPLLWFVAALLCVVAVIWIAVSKHHLAPLGAFVTASVPGEAELVLVNLRTALHKANTAVRKARLPKILVAIGIGLLLSALTLEYFSSMSTTNNAASKTERQTKGQE